nr:MAG TPA_asm: hypothetical protein [Caudoviricetes sp.]
MSEIPARYFWFLDTTTCARARGISVGHTRYRTLKNLNFFAYIRAASNQHPENLRKPVIFPYMDSGLSHKNLSKPAFLPIMNAPPTMFFRNFSIKEKYGEKTNETR